jgi:serine/threonine protein kinase
LYQVLCSSFALPFFRSHAFATLAGSLFFTLPLCQFAKLSAFLTAHFQDVDDLTKTFIRSMLQLDPEDRLTANELLHEKWITRGT